MSIQLSTVPIDDFRKGKIDKMNAAMDLCSDTDEQMDENTEEQQKTIFRQQSSFVPAAGMHDPIMLAGMTNPYEI